ncbi:hypothetical protein PVAG01_05609 [Phlyctema vagabunda]|uniref:Meiotic nuclear division protein 1 n=1 Tax=Phlyctema vagabunda TaxID=108571 RepID=A0ABR4PLA5_9HELO
MPPKSLPPAAKLAKLVEWFRSTAGVYNVKELEKAFASVAGVSTMQTKEYIQNLVDENQIRSERIGSGNWYWSFASDAQRSKEHTQRTLQAEEARLAAGIDELQLLLAQDARQRRVDADLLENRQADARQLADLVERAAAQVALLDQELAVYHDNDPEEYERKAAEAARFKAKAETWTSNVENLESFLMTLLNDRAALGDLMARICGDEYVAGEGLKELTP